MRNENLNAKLMVLFSISQKIIYFEYIQIFVYKFLPKLENHISLSDQYIT